MGNYKPESQSLSLQVQETAWWARELSACCKEGSPEPGWAAGQTKSSVQWVGASSGTEQHSAVWSSAVSAVVWSLPQLYLESGVVHPSGFLDKYLWHLSWQVGKIPKCLFPRVVLLCSHSCTDHVCRYLGCVSLPDVSNVT